MHKSKCVHTQTCTKKETEYYDREIMIFESGDPLNMKGVLTLYSLVQGDNIYGP